MLQMLHIGPANSFNIFQTNEVDAAAISMLLMGNWPLLQCLRIDCCQVTMATLHQLVKADWPLLRALDLIYCCSCNLDEASLMLNNKWPCFSHDFI